MPGTSIIVVANVSRASKILTVTFLLAAAGWTAPAVADIADEILAKAIQSYEAGDVQPAIGGINAALRGRLFGDQLARAYYYRGLAHRRAGQPGQAITDLTRALEYSGLSDAQRADAQENLQVAYQEAGIAAGEGVVVPRLGEMRVANGAATAAPMTGSIAAASNNGEAAAQRLPQHLAQAAPSIEGQSSSRPNSWASEKIDLAPLPTVPVAAKPRADVPPPRPKPAPGKGAGRDNEKPVAAIAPFVTQVSASPAALSTVEPRDVWLVIGESRSRSEAFQLAVRLTSQRGGQLGPHRPQISETKVADTSVYRLVLGPFQSVEQAMVLCGSLRDSGYDCAAE